MRKGGLTWADSKVCCECTEGGQGGPTVGVGWD